MLQDEKGFRNEQKARQSQEIDEKQKVKKQMEILWQKNAIA